MVRHTGAFFLLLTACLARGEVTLLDVQKVPLWGDPASAVVRIAVPARVPEIACDALVAGAGMGGMTTAETDGGNLTSKTTTYRSADGAKSCP